MRVGYYLVNDDRSNYELIAVYALGGDGKVFIESGPDGMIERFAKDPLIWVYDHGTQTRKTYVPSDGKAYLEALLSMKSSYSYYNNLI